MYLYLDLIWLLNFLIDFLLLWMTGLFRKVEVKKWRLCLAAMIGSSYVLFLFLPPLLPLYTFGVKILLSMLIVIVAFGFGSFQKFLLSFFMFYFVSFVTGGGLLGAHFLLQSNSRLIQGMVATQTNGYGNQITWLFILIGFPIMYWFSKSRWREIEVIKGKADALTKVRVHIPNHIIECTGLIDTGNQLYEPITKVPVMLIESVCFKNKLPGDVLEQINKKTDMAQLDFHTFEFSSEWMNRLRLVPYRGVHSGMELMLTLKPDQVEIIQGDVQYCTKRVLIGLHSDSLSRDGVFQAIVHPALVQNPQKEEAI
jgi:stage II sporulation protein GA (sporulation sigma-E factor processing peptidase)